MVRVPMKQQQLIAVSCANVASTISVTAAVPETMHLFYYDRAFFKRTRLACGRPFLDVNGFGKVIKGIRCIGREIEGGVNRNVVIVAGTQDVNFKHSLSFAI